MKGTPWSGSLRRFARSYVLAFSIPLVLMVIGFLRIGQTFVRYVESSSRSVLEHAAESVETYLEDIETISRQLALDPRVLELKHHVGRLDGDVVRLIYELQRDLTVTSLSHSIIDELYLLFESSSLIVSAHVAEQARFFYANRVRFDGYDFEQWMAAFFPASGARLSRTATTSYYPEAVVHVRDGAKQILPVVASVSIPPERPVYALYFVDPAVIRSILETVVVDPAAGNVVVSDASGRELIRYGSATGPDRAMVAFGTVGPSGLVYEAHVPTAQLLRSVQGAALLALATVVIAAVAGFVAAVILAQRTAKPIDAMFGKLGTVGPPRPSANPLRELERRFAETLDHSHELERSLAYHRSLALAGFVERLLRGFGTDGEAREMGLSRFLPLDSPCYRAMIVRTDPVGPESERVAIRDALEKATDGHGYVHPVSAEQFVMILGLADDNEERARTIAASSLDHVQRAAGTEGLCAIGSAQRSLSMIGRSFDEAAVAETWMMASDASATDGVVSFGEIPERENDAPPPDVERRLTTLIRAGKTDELEEYIASVRHDLGRPDGLGIHSDRLLLFHMLGAILRAQAFGTKSLGRESIDRFMRDAASPLSDVTTVFDAIAKTGVDLCRHVAEQSKSTPEVLADAVSGYVRDHFTDPSLSLASVAEHFGVSEPYLSKVVSRYAEAGFHELMERHRIDAARRLLESEELTVGEIAGRCGYAAMKTFASAFKRVTGVTPTGYRRVQQR